MPTFVGKFKGPWRFCTFCSERGRPMGTKSHVRKALPASIMTKGIGLIVLQQATFRTGCVYLNFFRHFLYVFKQDHTVVGNPVTIQCRERLRGGATVFCFILFYFIWKPWSMNLVFMFGKNPSAMEVRKLCSLQTVCLEVLSPSHSFSVFSSPSLSVSEHLW